MPAIAHAPPPRIRKGGGRSRPRSFLLRLRHSAEFYALRAGLALFRRLPPSVGARWAGKLGALWYVLDRKRRRIAQENILACGLANGRQQADRIARASFVHFGTMIAEALDAGRKNSVEPHVESGIHPATLALLEKPGQGLILVSGHIGNWEIAAQYLSRVKTVVGIAKDMRNPLTNRLILDLKTTANFQLIPMRDADAGRFFGVLKSGGILALLGDQHAKGDQLLLDFCGRPASMHASPALLHLVTKAPLCFGVCLREGPMRYRFLAGPPILHRPTGNRAADVRAILERINRELEAAMASCPEQYLWAHRRWKSRAAPALSGHSFGA
jgi:Kdo2-lipid IVA lauroyltransferase/acyltransferase